MHIDISKNSPTHRFYTKAEFDSALADFNARLTTFEAGINSKIDSQVTSYLDRNGIWNGQTQSLLTSNIIYLDEIVDGDGINRNVFYPCAHYGTECNMGNQSNIQVEYLDITGPVTKSGLLALEVKIEPEMVGQFGYIKNMQAQGQPTVQRGDEWMIDLGIEFQTPSVGSTPVLYDKCLYHLSVFKNTGVQSWFGQTYSGSFVDSFVIGNLSAFSFGQTLYGFVTSNVNLVRLVLYGYVSHKTTGWKLKNKGTTNDYDFRQKMTIMDLSVY